MYLFFPLRFTSSISSSQKSTTLNSYRKKDIKVSLYNSHVYQSEKFIFRDGRG
ncbi:hypothetical protein PGT21_034044 [Puccinia graminis f. sp. tritici]|uniref:Uncharacterized protein n=1 Tax=Puccinia graminis f. sp. tritici TaxID=56615 RepID=A0A5B0PBF9_PUCGR|nr:hypothetical protein PGT21_034044 [Puccinia graminis f. sp. tritici]